MTDLERRWILLRAAGAAFVLLTAGEPIAEGFARWGSSQGPKPGGTKGPETKPASKPAADAKAFEPGPQKDGSTVFDPANPPKVELQTKESPNGTFVKVGSDTVLVAQSQDKKQWYAVSAICTHKACAVSYKDADKCFRCPCHGSTFGLDGKVTKKPATADLAAYTVKEVKGKNGKKLLHVAAKS